MLATPCLESLYGIKIFVPCTLLEAISLYFKVFIFSNNSSGPFFALQVKERESMYIILYTKDGNFFTSLLPQTERDVSVRQRAVDLLYVMCDSTNAIEIVAEMLTYLKQADFAIREELVSIFTLTLLNELKVNKFSCSQCITISLIRRHLNCFNKETCLIR